jgi:transcriptional regulator with XRE-family HTH domain
MASLGEELRRERELRGISLQEISDSTKISLRYLRALEEDHLDILPGRFFTKSIIRAYAQYCGLEEEAVLNKYHEETQQKEHILEEEKKKRKTGKAFTPHLKKMFPYALTLILLSIVILSILYLYPTKERSSLLDFTDMPETSFTKDQIPPPLDAFSAQSFPEEKIFFTINFVEKTWLQLYVDGRLTIDGLKYPGDKEKVKALREIVLHLGNAGGVTYSLNNELGKPFGSSGAVVKNIRITPENLQEYLAREQRDKNPGENSIP